MRSASEIIDKYYPADNQALRDIYITHARQVAEKALSIARNLSLPLDPKMIEGAALTHDIGIFLTDAPGIECRGTEPYLRHGILGAEILRNEGAPAEWVGVAERHTGAGITRKQIEEHNLPLPLRDFMPQTLLERLICYADKFFSKTKLGHEKTLEEVRRSMLKVSPETLERFERLHTEFSRASAEH